MVVTAHRPVLIVIAGPNGSGKTTITTQILQHEWMEDAVYINPDQMTNSITSVGLMRLASDNQEATLLFRMVGGKVFKRYTSDIPEWAETIISEI